MKGCGVSMATTESKQPGHMVRMSDQLWEWVKEQGNAESMSASGFVRWCLEMQRYKKEIESQTIARVQSNENRLADVEVRLQRMERLAHDV